MANNPTFFLNKRYIKEIWKIPQLTFPNKKYITMKKKKSQAIKYTLHLKYIANILLLA